MKSKTQKVLKRLMCYPLIFAMCATNLSSSTLTAFATQTTEITSNEATTGDDTNTQKDDVTVTTDVNVTSDTETDSEDDTESDDPADVSSGDATVQNTISVDWQSMTEDEIYEYVDSLEDQDKADEILDAWYAYQEERLADMDWKEMSEWEFAIYIEALYEAGSISDDEYDALLDEYEAYQLSQMDWKTMTDAELEAYKATLSDEELEALEAEIAAYYANAEKYANYHYDEKVLGDSDPVLYGYDENGNEIYYVYVEDLDEIISLAEDGMDLKTFFEGTALVGFTLDDLYKLKETGHSLAGIFTLYASGMEIPDCAAVFIKNAILRALTEIGRAIRLPSYMQTRCSKVMKARRSLLQATGREPSLSALAEITDLSEKEVKDALLYSLEPISLDTPITNEEDNDACIGTYIESKYEEVDLSYVDRQNLSKLLTDAMNETLSEREKYIIVNYFGLNGLEQQPLGKIGEKFNISRERIRQLEREALGKIRNSSLAWILDCYRKEL